MKRDGRTQTAWIAIGIALAVSLPVLAALQYLWIGELSEAERERMHNNVRGGAQRLTQEFNSELMRAVQIAQFVHGSMPFDVPLPVDGAPGLVRRSYVASGPDSLQCSTDDRMMPCGWPPELERMRRLLSHAPNNTPPVIDEALPAVAVPKMRFPPRPGPPPGRPQQPQDGVWLIVVFNRGQITADFLPHLIDKHFGVDYNVQVVRRADRSEAVYKSSPGLGVPLTPADAIGPLLVFGPSGGPFRGVPDRPPFGIGMGRPIEVNAPWELRVQHKAGSLDAVVAATRWKNLAISLAVMLTLTAGLSMLLIAVRRSQRLAHLQMEFVAGISHELRTPLAVITSAADNMADGLVSTQQQAQRYGTTIQTESRRLFQMIEQVLRYSGIESGQMKYRLAPTDVAAVVERSVSECLTGPEGARVRIKTDVEQDLPVIPADEAAISQCIRNLIENAAKHSGAKDPVLVRAHRSDGHICIGVRDNGVGIDSADAPHVFDAFYRGRNAIDSQTEGSGLGLSIVRKIAEAHGGSVELKSRPGHGCEFTLKLPLEKRT